MGDVTKFFMGPLERHFKIPQHVEDHQVEGFYQDYTEALGFYGDRCLEMAAKKIIVTRTVRVLPTVAESLDACAAAHLDLSGPDLKASAKDRNPEWSPEAVANANRLLAGYEFRDKALEQGWILSLWDFLREKARWPNRHEAEKIAKQHHAQVRKTDVFLADQRAKGLPIVPDVKKLFAMRADRLRKLSDIVLKAA